jgi:hypothetical protein
LQYAVQLIVSPAIIQFVVEAVCVAAAAVVVVAASVVSTGVVVSAALEVA